MVTDFRVLNERLVCINHTFPLVLNFLDAIGNSECQVFTIIDLRDVYHTLKLAKESQMFVALHLSMDHPLTIIFEWGWVCPPPQEYGVNLQDLLGKNYQIKRDTG